MSNVVITNFKNVRSSTPTDTVSMPIPEWLDHWRPIKHREITDKQQARAWCMTEFQPNKPRKEEFAIATFGVILDLDEPMTEEEVGELVKKLYDFGKAYVVHSTYSSKENAYKLRIIFPLAAPMSVEEFKEAKLPERAAKLLQVKIDPTCCTPVHVYYEPTCSPDTDAEHFVDASESDVPWAEDDFPALEPGERKLHVTSPAKASVKAVQAAAKSGAKKEIFDLIDKVVRDNYNGVAPIFCEQQFFVFQGRHWAPISTRALKRFLLQNVFKEKRSVAEITEILDTMAVRYYLDEFPKPAMLGDADARPVDLKYVVCCLNGTIDPLTGDVVPDSPDYFQRVSFPFDYDSKARCRRWLQFLDDVFQGDADKDQKIELLQEFIGLMLIPCTKFQVMLWLYGQGANGKSVVNEIVTALLGLENISAIPLSRLSKRFQSAELAGKLANITDEVGADGALADDILKQAVAGNRLQGERKNKDPFYFEPYARFMVATNHLPRVKDTSHGFFRRLIILQFNRVFTTDEQDRDLVPKLKQELPGIFLWALAGLQRLFAQGTFTQVPSSAVVVQQYQEECNPAAMFVRDMVILPPPLAVVGKKAVQHRSLAHDVYRLYRAYCAVKGYVPMSDGRFGKEMKNLGIMPQKSSGKNYYPVKLKKPEDAGYRDMGRMGFVDYQDAESLLDDSKAARSAY